MKMNKVSKDTDITNTFSKPDLPTQNQLNWPEAIVKSLLGMLHFVIIVLIIIKRKLHVETGASCSSAAQIGHTRSSQTKQWNNTAITRCWCAVCGPWVNTLCPQDPEGVRLCVDISAPPLFMCPLCWGKTESVCSYVEWVLLKAPLSFCMFFFSPLVIWALRHCSALCCSVYQATPSFQCINSLSVQDEAAAMLLALWACAIDCKIKNDDMKAPWKWS